MTDSERSRPVSRDGLHDRGEIREDPRVQEMAETLLDIVSESKTVHEYEDGREGISQDYTCTDVLEAIGIEAFELVDIDAALRCETIH